MAQSNEKIQLLINAKDNTKGVLRKIENSILGIVSAYALMRVGVKAFEATIISAANYEKTIVSLESVVKATGRDMNAVYAEMETHLGGLASKAQVAEGFLKGMTTTLTTQQISKMTLAIKDASLAMGEDFGRQLPLIIKAVKQLNPAILDNIGVTVRLDQINKKIREGYFGMAREINEVTQQHAIFTEIMKQTAIFQGQEEKRLTTLAGKWEKMTAALSDFALASGQAADKIKEGGGLLDWFSGVLRDATDSLNDQVPVLERLNILLTTKLLWAWDQEAAALKIASTALAKWNKEAMDAKVIAEGGFNFPQIPIFDDPEAPKRLEAGVVGMERMNEQLAEFSLVGTEAWETTTVLEQRLADFGMTTDDQIKRTVNLGKELGILGAVGGDAMEGIALGAKEALEEFETFGMEVTRIMNESLVGSTISATNQMIGQFQLLTTQSHGFFKQMGVNFINEFVQRALRGLVMSGLLKIFGNLAFGGGGGADLANAKSQQALDAGVFGAPGLPSGGDSLAFAINNRQSSITQDDRNLTGDSLVKFR